MKMVRILLVSLSVSMTACSRVDHYTEAMSHGMEEDSLQHYYSARYGSKPQNRGYLSDDYFDITLEEPKEEPKEEPRKHSVTQQVKKAMLASTKQKKTPVPKLASKPSVVVQQQQTQATTNPPVSAQTLSNSQDPTFVLSRILYHMARLPL